MRVERVVMLRFDDGSRIPWGVPEFMSEEEATDFLQHIQTELEEGAARYFAQCCKPRRGGASSSTGADDNERMRLPPRRLTFTVQASEHTRLLEERVNELHRLGRASLKERFVQQAEARRELEARQRADAAASRERPRGHER